METAGFHRPPPSSGGFHPPPHCFSPHSTSFGGSPPFYTPSPPPRFSSPAARRSFRQQNTYHNRRSLSNSSASASFHSVQEGSMFDSFSSSSWSTVDTPNQHSRSMSSNAGSGGGRVHRRRGSSFVGSGGDWIDSCTRDPWAELQPKRVPDSGRRLVSGAMTPRHTVLFAPRERRLSNDGDRDANNDDEGDSSGGPTMQAKRMFDPLQLSSSLVSDGGGSADSDSKPLIEPDCV